MVITNITLKLATERTLVVRSVKIELKIDRPIVGPS